MLLQPDSIEAKRRKHKGKDGDHHDSHRSKTKTKWSTSTDLGGSDAQVATEEHGYYVKRTYSPQAGIDGKRKSPPYLAIPIAWFNCEAGKEGCQQASNSAAINSPAHALSEGYLCDDDCEDGYEPICGQTPNEVAVFYNKCKLNVAKCRTHGLWTDLPYEQCKETYPKETAYTEKKFRCSPFFRDNSTKETQTEAVQKIEHDQIETETETEHESEKEKDSNESSEEEQDKKKNKNKNENKDEKEDKEETLEPIALALQSKPAEVPVPAPIEAIALPPLPVKTTPERLPEPTLVKVAESKPEIQTQSEPQTETESQPQIPVETKPQIAVQTKPQIPTQTKPQIPTQTKPQIQAKPQPLPALIQSQIQHQVQQHIQSQIHAQTKPQTEQQGQTENQAETENQTQTEKKAQTENLIQTEELSQPQTDAQISPVKTVEHPQQATKVTKPLEAAIVSKDKLKYVFS